MQAIKLVVQALDPIVVQDGQVGERACRFPIPDALVRAVGVPVPRQEGGAQAGRLLIAGTRADPVLALVPAHDDVEAGLLRLVGRQGLLGDQVKGGDGGGGGPGQVEAGVDAELAIGRLGLGRFVGLDPKTHQDK